MVKLAFPLLLLLFTAVFASPSPVEGTDDQRRGMKRKAPDASYLPIQERGEPSRRKEDVAVDGDIDPEQATGLTFDHLYTDIHTRIASNLDLFDRFSLTRVNKRIKIDGVLLDDRKAVEKELAELDKFRFHNDKARMDQLVETYLFDKRSGIRQAIRLIRQRHPYLQFKAADDLMKEHLPALIRVHPNRVKHAVKAARGRTVIEVMEKFQYEEFNSNPLIIQRRIDKYREGILLGENGIAYRLLQHNDDQFMDTETANLLDEKANGMHDTREPILLISEIRQAIAEARDAIQLEKEKLDATQLAAYDDDQKMSEFLLLPENILELSEIQAVVNEARWRVTLHNAVVNRKKWALSKLLRFGKSYDKSYLGSYIKRLASTAEDPVTIEMLEMLLEFSGWVRL